MQRRRQIGCILGFALLAASLVIAGKPVVASYLKSKAPQRVFQNTRNVVPFEYFPTWKTTSVSFDSGDALFCDVRRNFILVFNGAASSFSGGYRIFTTEYSYNISTLDGKWMHHADVVPNTVRRIGISGDVHDMDLGIGAAAIVQNAIDMHERAPMKLLSR